MSQEKFWKNPKPAILQLFDQRFCSENPFPNATFYTAESGAVGESIEPKQSWEVRRCARYSGKEQSSLDDNLLENIAVAMHSVISTVNMALGLPPSLLLQEDPHSSTYGCTCKENEGPCNVDLLRVFHYEAVDPGEQDILGSSPHTDWGTFTVVWQDNVGGLQTYCQSCQVWQDVKTYEQEEDILHFVIHVGDATSLAMARSKQNQQCSATDGPSSHAFPSPRHRVVSPRTEPRASLVYFVYPPPTQSLESLAAGLTSWVQSHSPSQVSTTIPFETYYLLLDQSASTNAKRTPEEVFDAIYTRPMQEVFVEKWQQVQRSG